MRNLWAFNLVVDATTICVRKRKRKKLRKNRESCPTQVTWKIKFKCHICLSFLFLFDLSVLSVSCVLVVLSFLSCLSWWSWWPWWHRDYHDDHDQGCINCAILLSGIGARGVSSEHMENVEMFSENCALVWLSENRDLVLGEKQAYICWCLNKDIHCMFV